MSRQARTLLCIDDDEQGLAIRKLLLEAHGFRVLTATGGREGLRIFRRSRVDAVLVDYEMPQMGGVKVANQIKRAGRRIPVVMLSAHPWIPEDARDRVDAYVSKGGSTAELIDVLEEKIKESPSKAAGKARGAAMVGAAFGVVVERVISGVRDAKQTVRPQRLVGHFPVHKPTA